MPVTGFFRTRRIFAGADLAVGFFTASWVMACFRCAGVTRRLPGEVAASSDRDAPWEPETVCGMLTAPVPAGATATDGVGTETAVTSMAVKTHRRNDKMRDPFMLSPLCGLRAATLVILFTTIDR